MEIWYLNQKKKNNDLFSKRNPINIVVSIWNIYTLVENFGEKGS